MPVRFGDRPCLDPRTLYRDCLDHRVSTAWAGLPNAFTCPLGATPGEGWLLMARSDLTALSADLTFPDLYDLTFGDPTGQATAKSLTVVGVECLTPGARDAEAACLVRVADRRAFLRWTPIDEAYNARSASDGSLIASTLNSSSEWTWTGVVQSLWDTAPLVLGDFPGLPFAPEGTPGDLEFYHQPLSRALQVVLDRIGCALKLDPLADTFSIVRVGDATDAVASVDALAALEAAGRRVWDDYPSTGVPASVPEFVRVLFRRVPHVRDGSSPWHFLDRSRAGAASGSYRAGAYAFVEDEMEALGGLTPTNLTALGTRADERAADYFRRLLAGCDALRVVYSGALSDPAVMPGPGIESVRWSETAHETAPDGGLITELRRHSRPTRGSWPDLTQPAGGSYCALAGLQTTDCLTATGPSNSVVLAYDAGHWVSTDELTYPGGSGVLDFWFADGRLHLSLAGSGYGDAGELLDCGDGCWKGGPLTGHGPPSGAADCAGETFTVCLACEPCVIPSVLTPCCPDPLPEALTGTVSAATGFWSFADGVVFPLTYTTTGVLCFATALWPGWSGRADGTPDPSATPMYVWFQCAGFGDTFFLSWYRHLSNTCVTAFSEVGGACNPLVKTFLFNDGLGTFTITVTE